MIITDTWVEIASAGSGALVQKFGGGSLTVCYAGSTPVGGEPRFAATDNDPHVYPAVAGKAIHVRATGKSVSVSYEVI